jgi:hypothetical protein
VPSFSRYSYKSRPHVDKIDTAVYLLKARTVEPEKQTLLANVNGSVNTFPWNVYACDNRGTVGNGVFYSVRAKRL